ncbi:MAG: serine/threonine-protein kinase [Hyphomicrobiaceae bacterium]|nr:serine/threonine-protein kinase [Hyphomicrobiaceae bacterium]
MIAGRNILPEGTVLDGCYRIERVVGFGGFGITYEAHDTNLGTHVAIKEYFPQDFGERDAGMSVRPKSEHSKGQFEWGRTSFLQEGRTLAEFDHAGIVRVLRVFEANATAYMVMRFERGKSFSAWLKELGRQPTQAELDRIAGPLLDVLELMHARNFLHRDIAPDNIIIREDGSPVLLDFGSARRVMAQMSRMLTGIVKAGYSPQEQYASDNRLQGPWTDLYALGGTLYRAVAGQAPMEAMLRFDGDPMETAARTGAGAYRASFLEAIDACLAVRPSQRPQSVAELRPRLMDGPTASVPGGIAAQTRRTDAASNLAAPAPAGLRTALVGLWSRLNLVQVSAAALAVALCAVTVMVVARTPGPGPGPQLPPVEAGQAASRALEELRAEQRRRAQEEAERQRAEAERRAQEEEQERQQQAEAEAERLRQAQAAEDEMRRQAQRAEVDRKRQADREAAERARAEAAEAERKRQVEAARLKREAEAAAAAAAAARAQQASKPAQQPQGAGSRPGTGGTCTSWMFHGSSCTDAGGRWCTQTPNGRRCG